MDTFPTELVDIISEYLDFSDVINLYIYLNRDLPKRYLLECVDILRYKNKNSICTVCDKSFVQSRNKRKWTYSVMCQHCGNMVCDVCVYPSSDLFCKGQGKRFLCAKCSLLKDSGFCRKCKQYFTHPHRECEKYY